MKRSHAWLVTMPIALAGIEAAHALANAVFGSPEGAGELFASAASGSGLAPIAAGLGAACVLAGLAAKVVGAGASRPRTFALPFALLPPLAFVLLEVAEGLFHRGTVPWSDLHEPTFLVGLALQVPFALLGYSISRLVLRLGSRLCELLTRASGPQRPAALVEIVSPGSLRLRSRRGSPELGRAPPSAVGASG